jgi:hypothetical protein
MRRSLRSGYIISQADAFTSRSKLKNKLLHYDVIIYDELNSPILWYESNSDSSEQGKKRAIPAEYVSGVLEVKSTFNEKNISDAFNKLGELAPLLAKIDQVGRNQRLFNKMVPINFQRGFMGGIIMQAEGMDSRETGKFQYAIGSEPSKYGGIAPNGWSKSIEVEPGKHLYCLLHWTQSCFAQFAFDLVAVMNGRYRSGIASSLHGLSFVLPPGTE